jgi:FeS assembly SUF system protein
MASKLGRVPLPTLDEDAEAAPSAHGATPELEAGPKTGAAGADQKRSKEDLEKQIVAQLRTCYDPEIPIDIYELGLVYGIDIDPEHTVTIRMTLTSPACPVAGTLPGDVQRKVASVSGVTSAKVDLVWDPPWDPSRMTEAARLELGLDYY